MRIAFFGSPEFALPSLKAIAESDHEISVVITQPDKPRGRKLEITPTAVKNEALNLGLNVLTPLGLKSEDFIQSYKSFDPQVNVVIAYGRLMPDWLIKYPQFGTINAHASLLPRWRGAAPIRRAIMQGDKTTGITIQHVVRELDAGDIALQEEIEILDDDNNETLSDKLAQLSAKLLIEALDLINLSKMPKIKQDESKVTYAQKITKDDLKIDFNKSADELFNQVRGLAPKPGAFVIFREKRLKIMKAKVINVEADPSKIIDVTKKGIIIGIAKNSFVLEIVQPEGGKAMRAFEFAKGRQIKPGDFS